MLSIILDEEVYAKEVEKGGYKYLNVNGITKYLTMLYKGKYMSKKTIKGKDGKEDVEVDVFDTDKIYNDVVSILSKQYNYSVDELVNETKPIKGTISKYCNPQHQLKETDGIKVTKSELNKIRELKNQHLELLAFSMLVIKKVENYKYNTSDSSLKMDAKEFYCRFTNCKKDRKTQASSFRNLTKKHYIKIPDLSQFGRNTNIELNYIDLDDSDYEILITDFREVSLIYLKYIGENIIECEECGRLIVRNGSSPQKYCKECSKEKQLLYQRESMKKIRDVK